MAFVLDQGTRSVYVYDTARRRFIGPAVRLDPRHERFSSGYATHRLPGYPTVTAKPPQHLAVVGRRVVVAGGLDGTVVVVPIEDARLRQPRPIPVPIREVMLEGGS